MTKNNALWIGVAAAGLILLYLLAKNDQAQTDQTAAVKLPGGYTDTTNQVPPTYLTYNLPKLPDINITYPTSNVGNGSGSNTGATCGCVGPSPQFFSSLTSLLNEYESKVSGFVQSYWDNIGSAFPDTVSQYFNAIEGQRLYKSSSQFLQG